MFLFVAVDCITYLKRAIGFFSLRINFHCILHFITCLFPVHVLPFSLQVFIVVLFCLEKLDLYIFNCIIY